MSETNNMNIPQPVGEEKIVFKNKFFEIVQQPMRIGEKEMTFESARRAPGTRIVITDGDKILLTKEWRSELQDYDWRLPGGKVFDSLEEYNKARESNEDMLKHAKNAAIKECKEETGHVPKTIKHIHTTAPGATVVWDLYYFLAEETQEHKDGQQLEHGEHIEVHWFTYDEVKKMCLQKEIKEDRTVGVLLRYLLEKP